MKWFKQIHRWCNKNEWERFLAILVLVLRLPRLVMPHYYGDEEIYFVMGRAWKMGVPLYKAMFDHKPPLIYIMAGIAPTMLAFRGLLTALMVVHTVLFWQLAKLFWSKTKPFLAYASSLIFVIITTLPTLEGLTVNAELLMMIPVTAAVVLLWNAKASEWKKFAIAGLLGGIGWLFKIPVAADMVAIGLFFFAFKKKTFKESFLSFFSWSFLAYTIAFVAPLALTFVYYYLKGTGPDYLATVLTVNLGYVSSWSTSTYAFNPFKSGLLVRGVILAVVTLGLYLSRKKLDKSMVLAALWFAFSMFGALLSARPYPHYLQELAAPTALFAPFLFATETLAGWLVVAVVVGIAGLTQWQIKFWGYPTISVYKNYYDYVMKKIDWNQYLSKFDNATRNYEAARYLNARLAEHDQIYVWGTDPTLYLRTNRLPPGGKYIVCFDVRDLNKYDYTIDNIVKNMPKYIIILPGSGEFSDLSALLDHKYLLVKDTSDYQIYIRL